MFLLALARQKRAHEETGKEKKDPERKLNLRKVISPHAAGSSGPGGERAWGRTDKAEVGIGGEREDTAAHIAGSQDRATDKDNKLQRTPPRQTVCAWQPHPPRR